MMIRDYAIERDDAGRPTRLVWMGDRPTPPTPQKPTPADILAAKWARWTGQTTERG
jgi:hypothetical protein